MPLPQQFIGVDFTGRLDTKADGYVSVPGTLTQLKNGQFDTRNTINRRDGVTQIANSPTSGSMLATFKNELVLLASNFDFSTRNAQSGTFVSKGTLARCSAQVSEIIRNNATQSQVDVAYLSGYSVWVWKDTRTGCIRYSVFDETTGASIVADKALDTVGACPRVFSLSDRVGFVWTDLASNKIKYTFITTATLDTPNSPIVDISTTYSGASGQQMAVETLGSTFCIAYRTTTPNLRIEVFGNTGGSVLGPATVAGDFDGPLCVAAFSGGQICVFRVIQTTSIIAYVYSSSLVAVGNVTVNVPTATVSHVVANQSSTALEVFWDQGATAPVDAIRRAIISATPTILGAAATVAKGVSLASESFVYNTRTYVLALHQSTGGLQHTYFLLDVTLGLTQPLVTARIVPWEAATRYAANSPPSFFTITSGCITIPTLRRGRVAVSSGTYVTPFGVSRVDLDFDVNKPLQWCEFNSLLHIAAACPVMYDGTGLVETGFNLYPEVSLADAGAGSIEVGTRQYVAIYEWTDAQGNVHRSAPSVPVSITIAASHNVTVTISTLRLTRKIAPTFQEVNIVVFRTEDASDIFYRLNAVSSPLANDTTVDTVNYTDSTTDAALISNEILYTTGDVLENQPPPGSRLLCEHQNRLFCAGGENPYAFQYTKERVKGEGPAFNEVLAGEVPPAYGAIADIASMDDKLVFLCEKGPYYINGEGPNNLGTDNRYSRPQQVAGDTGCRLNSPRSVSTPMGIVFPSQRGFRLLSRGFTIEPLGVPDDANYPSASTKIYTGFLDEARHQIKFIDANGLGHVYDYLWNQWSNFTNQVYKDGLSWRGTTTYLSSAVAGVLQEGGNTDNGTAVGLTVETGWIHFGAVQGFKRVYQVLFLGRFVASSTLTISVGYDYSDTYSQSEVITTGSLVSASPLQFRFKLARQKCTAIRVRIVETGGSGGGFAMSNLGFLVGAKKGATKLPATKTV